MLAGRSLPLLLSTSALFATWFGSETVFGASSQFMEGGLYAVIEDPFGAALCLLLFGLFFAPKLYQMNLLTLGDFFKVRFGKRTELIASICLAPPYLGYIAAQLVAMGLILNVVAGIATWQGVVLSACVVTFYTYVGGMWAISITDFVQSVVIIIGLVALAWVLSDKAGGVSLVLQAMPDDSKRFLPGWNGSEVISYVAAWSVLGLGSIPSQDVFQRAMSSGSAKIAARSCYAAAFLYLTVALIPLFISLCVKILYPQLVQGDTQLTLPSMVIAHTSLPIQILFFGSLLSAIMSTTSSAILAPASIVSENLVRPLLAEKMSDRQMLVLTRVSVVIFSAGATIMALMRGNIYELVGESSILSLATLFAPLTLGLYWNRANSAGAIASMMSGFAVWIAFRFIWDTSIPPLVPATCVSVACMIGASLFYHWGNHPKKC